MAEYQADELASGSDNARKLVKDEKAAERKVLKRKRAIKPGSKSFGPKFPQHAVGAYLY